MEARGGRLQRRRGAGTAPREPRSGEVARREGLDGGRVPRGGPTQARKGREGKESVGVSRRERFPRAVNKDGQNGRRSARQRIKTKKDQAHKF